MNQSNFVFGYGSLVNVQNLEQYLQRELQPDLDYVICSLENWQRCWNVAMDNSIDLPDYKYYRDRQTKERLKVFVTFLNVRPCLDKIVRGILFCVSDAELKNLDLRERNYQRIEITQQLDIKIEISGNAWTYIGLSEAEQRYQTGLLQDKAVIARTYFDSVQNAYISLGNKEYANYLDTTDKLEVSIIDLEMCRSES